MHLHEVLVIVMSAVCLWAVMDTERMKREMKRSTVSFNSSRLRAWQKRMYSR